jgi:hypothetical protein
VQNDEIMLLFWDLSDDSGGLAKTDLIQYASVSYLMTRVTGAKQKEIL